MWSCDVLNWEMTCWELRRAHVPAKPLRRPFQCAMEPWDASRKKTTESPCHSTTTPYLQRTTTYYNVLLRCYSALQSTTPVLLEYYSCTTPVLLRTTKYCLGNSIPQSTTPVLLRTTPVLPGTTLLLLPTTLRNSGTTKYYSGTILYYIVFVILRYYSSTTPYYKVAFRATKYYSAITPYFKVDCAEQPMGCKTQWRGTHEVLLRPAHLNKNVSCPTTELHYVFSDVKCTNRRMNDDVFCLNWGWAFPAG